jgi:hypothetical protein
MLARLLPCQTNYNLSPCVNGAFTNQRSEPPRINCAIGQRRQHGEVDVTTSSRKHVHLRARRNHHHDENFQLGVPGPRRFTSRLRFGNRFRHSLRRQYYEALRWSSEECAHRGMLGLRFPHGQLRPSGDKTLGTSNGRDVIRRDGKLLSRRTGGFRGTRGQDVIRRPSGRARAFGTPARSVRRAGRRNGAGPSEPRTVRRRPKCPG